MIKLPDSQIAQILPEYLSDRASVQALSFALGRAVGRLAAWCGNIGVFAAIDSAPDYVLDMLALELNTQYYDDTLPIQVKRKLVKNTMAWYVSAGTPQAVEELVIKVFGKGEVKEWFQYGGEPFFFKILTNAPMDRNSIKQFTEMITCIKNTRSHLERLEFDRELAFQLYSYGVCMMESRVKIGWEE